MTSPSAAEPAETSSGAPAPAGAEDEVGRLEALLLARSGEVRDLLVELGRVRALLRDAVARFPSAAGDPETMALRGELAGLRARADEAEQAFEGADRGSLAAAEQRRAARAALEQARTALVEVSAAIGKLTGNVPLPGSGAGVHDTLPGLSLPDLDPPR